MRYYLDQLALKTIWPVPRVVVLPELHCIRYIENGIYKRISNLRTMTVCVTSTIVRMVKRMWYKLFYLGIPFVIAFLQTYLFHLQLLANV